MSVRGEGGAGRATPAPLGWSSPRTGPAIRRSRSSTALSGGTISDLDGARLRAAMAGARRCRAGAVHPRRCSEVPTTWAGVPTSFSAGGLTPFGHALKPDVTAPGAEIISLDASRVRWRRVRGHGRARASRRRTSPGAAALLLQRHPDWNAKQMKSALMSTAGPVVRRHGAHPGVLGARGGRWPRQRRCGRPAARLHGSAVALVRLPGRQRRGREPYDPRHGVRRGRRRRDVVGGDQAAGRIGRGDASKPHRSRSHRAARRSCRSLRARQRALRRATTSASWSCGGAATFVGSRTPSPSRGRN